MNNLGWRYNATAKHADDVVETVACLLFLC